MTLLALIHGAWHDGASWGPLVPHLERAGYDVVAPDLPIDDLDAGLAEYAAVVRDAIGDAPDAVLVGHSLGSDTATVVAATHPVRAVVFLCPRLGGLPLGDDAPPRFHPDAPMPGGDELGRGAWDPGDAIRRMYSRLAPADARALAGRLRPQADVRRHPFPVERWPAVPVVVVAAEDDEWFPPASQRWAAEHVLRARYAEIPGGHFPMVERPAELTALLVRLLEDL